MKTKMKSEGTLTMKNNAMKTKTKTTRSLMDQKDLSAGKNQALSSQMTLKLSVKMTTTKTDLKTRKLLRGVRNQAF